MTPPRYPPSLFVVCLAAVAQAFTFTNHAALIPWLVADLAITPAQAGLLSTAMFLSGGMLAIPLGMLTDRLGAKRTMSLSLALLAITTAGLGVAPSYPVMLALKVCSGAGFAAPFVVGGQYVTTFWPPERRALAQGVYGGMTQLGVAASILALPSLGEQLGWRIALSLSALPAAIACIVWSVSARSETTRAPRGSLRAMAREPVVWILGVAHTGMFSLGIVVGTWVAVYLVHEFALTLPVAGALGALALLTGVPGRPLGGLLIARGMSPRSVMLASLGLASAALLLMALPARPLALAVAAMIVAGMGTSLGYAAVVALAGRARPDDAGAALGIIGMISTGDVILGAPLVGWLLALTGGFTVPFALLAAVPALASLGCLALPHRHVGAETMTR